jgi:hypothetical protein
MASQPATNSSATLDLSRWKKAPVWAIAAGIGFLVLGFITAGRHGMDTLLKQFGYSWLVAFMFFLSLCLGGMFLTLAHHLFDANWSVPLRRINENIACLALPLAVLSIPFIVLGPKLYPWMSMATPDHALHAKSAMLNKPFWYIRWLVYFAVWIGLAFTLRRLSVAQDKDGAAKWTFQMRRVSYVGIFLFALSLTFAAIDWMKSLQHQWFSTMYGVWYFAGSVWTYIATLYVITAVLKRSGTVKEVLRPTLFYYVGSLFFAFTVFYAYITFSQYFIQWNANMPEEIFWYKLREKGTWWWLSMVIIFGHFFVPFLSLLRIDVKLKLAVMLPMAVWAWLMHYCDLQFNVMPVFHTENFVLHFMDIGAFLLIAGVMALAFLRFYNQAAPYPLRDPRLKASQDNHEIPPVVGPAGVDEITP